MVFISLRFGKVLHIFRLCASHIAQKVGKTSAREGYHCYHCWLLLSYTPEDPNTMVAALQKLIQLHSHCQCDIRSMRYASVTLPLTTVFNLDNARCLKLYFACGEFSTSKLRKQISETKYVYNLDSLGENIERSEARVVWNSLAQTKN